MDVTKEWLGSSQIELWSEYHSALATERKLTTVHADLCEEWLDGMCGRAEMDAALAAVVAAQAERQAAFAAYGRSAR